MPDLATNLAYLVALNGGELVGKTRLQKLCYLLDACGAGLDVAFDYHHYGPFSAELAFAADDAEALGLLCTEQRHGFHGVPYTVFKSTDEQGFMEEPDPARATRQRCLDIMRHYSALVLELAATLVFLERQEQVEKAWEELKRRKAAKVNEERLDQVRQLLGELGLLA